MAMECTRCNYRDESSKRCPKCGSEMRYTLLGDVQQSEDDKEDVAKSEKKGPPGIGKRIQQWLFGLMLVHVLTYAVAIGGYYLADYQKIDLSEIQKTYPSLLPLVLFLLPLLAIVFGVLLGSRDVYLAQLVGLVVGGTGTVAILVERIFMPELEGIPELAPVWYEWLLLPLLGTVIGFFCGLRVTGKLEVGEKEVQYKTFNAWDRKAKPKFKEIAPKGGTRRKRLMFGIIMTLILTLILKRALKRGLSGQAFRAFGLDLGIPGFTILLGAIVAGSGTKSGLSQGLLLGIGIFGVNFFLDWPQETVDIVWRLCVYLPSGIIGGLIGRKIFGPPRVYSGREE